MLVIYFLLEKYQHRHDQSAKYLGRRHHATHVQRVYLSRLHQFSRKRRYRRRLCDVATMSHINFNLHRTWSYLLFHLLRNPRKKKNIVCKRIESAEASSRREYSRQRQLAVVPRPRLDAPQQAKAWDGNRYTNTEDICKVSRVVTSS